MNKKDLKTLIKPLVKECIHEVLLEEGLLSNVVAEVATGLQGALLVESTPRTATPQPTRDDPPAEENRRQAAVVRRQKLMEAIGADAYNGVNLFEGTAPMTAHEVAEPKPGAVELGDPRDAGVDISSLMGVAPRMWNAIKQKQK